MGVFVILFFVLSTYVAFSRSQMVPKSKNGALLNTIELMALHGYKGERHEVTTEDGYKLVLFRITPKKLPATPVLLQHGLSLSSDVFVLEKTALAFKLSDLGYDVWLPNSRGNVYSHSHEKLISNDTKFWDFTYNELGYYDLPKTIDYILDKTKQPQLFYIGHSAGTTIFFVMASTRPEYNKKIKGMIGLAPVAFFTGKMAIFAKQPTYVEMSRKLLDAFAKEGKVEAFPRIEWEQPTHQINCTDVPEAFVSFCSSLLEMAADVIGGAYFPAGMSVKTLSHYRQNVLNDSFRKYDFGSESANNEVYKSPTPPDYDLTLVTTPVYLVNGPDDMLVDPNDVKMLQERLPTVVEAYSVPDPKFGHADYLFIMTEEDEEDRNHFRLELYDQLGKWLEKMDKA